MTALGLDIYNGNSDGYDMHRVASDLGPGGFVIHKASQGWAGGPGGWIDWKLQGAIARARAAGIRRVGGYHWLLRGNGAAQADQFAQALDLIGGRAHVGAFIDYERNDWNQALNPDAATLNAFLARCAQIGIPNPVVYTAAWYTNSYSGAQLNIPGVPLWWSGYINVGRVPIGQALAGVTPNWIAGFDGWDRYAIRQFSSNVLVAGNPSDVNVSYLTDAALDRLFGVGPAGPPPAPAADRFLFHPTIELGSNDHGAGPGKPVTDCQNALNVLYHHESKNDSARLVPDGVFGPATDARVRDLQTKCFHAADGIIGPRTWLLLGFLLTANHR